MYQYHARADAMAVLTGEMIGLHDRRAESGTLEGETLTLHFPQGFWVSGKHPASPGGKPMVTGESTLTFRTAEDITVYLYREEAGRTIREESSAAALLELLNSKGYSLEFLYPYYGWRSFRFDCWLWFDAPPYHRECELLVSAEEALYAWDAMQEAEE